MPPLPGGRVVHSRPPVHSPPRARRIRAAWDHARRSGSRRERSERAGEAGPLNDTMVTLVGNAATAVEHRQTAAGVTVARFRLAATSRRWDKARECWTDGGTSFYTVRSWRTLADNVAASVAVGEPLGGPGEVAGAGRGAAAGEGRAALVRRGGRRRGHRPRPRARHLRLPQDRPCPYGGGPGLPPHRSPHHDRHTRPRNNTGPWSTRGLGATRDLGTTRDLATTRDLEPHDTPPRHETSQHRRAGTPWPGMSVAGRRAAPPSVVVPCISGRRAIAAPGLRRRCCRERSVAAALVREPFVLRRPPVP